MSPTGPTVFQKIGEATFVELVSRFYEGVARDELLRPMYPEEDLSGARERLTLFLIQYWGGPTTYSLRRGHPRLRLRHAPFAVDKAARDRWLEHMTAALESMDLPAEIEGEMRAYFESASTAMINSPSS